jgi:hypothetical protein
MHDWREQHQDRLLCILNGQAAALKIPDICSQIAEN